MEFIYRRSRWIIVTKKSTWITVARTLEDRTQSKEKNYRIFVYFDVYITKEYINQCIVFIIDRPVLISEHNFRGLLSHRLKKASNNQINDFAVLSNKNAQLNIILFDGD